MTRVVLVLLAALLAAPASASAHGIAGRADLPIPAAWFALAAAVVLVVSFLALAAQWTRPRLAQAPERELLRLPRAADVVLGTLGVAGFAVVVFAGLFGADSERDNLAPTTVFVAFWVGVPFLSLLVGDVWRLLSPWRALGRAAGWCARRLAGSGGLPDPLAYPARAGRWPAVAGLAGFALCELVWADGRAPQTLALLAVAYLAVQLVGQGIYGVEAWTRNADGFGVWFSLVASLAPLARRDGVLVARWPGTGTAREAPPPGTLALLVVAVGTTAFDSLKEGALFNDLVPRGQDALRDFGLGPGPALELVLAAGLALSVALVAVVWLGAVAGMPLPGGARRRDVLRLFAPALVPIAVAYVVAHYFSLLAFNGQDLWRLASDPLGDGADLLGTATAGIDYSILSPEGIWYVQVAVLLAGHVGALVLGHDRALELYGAAPAAARSQRVMLVAMMCFTGFGLWLLSEANA